MKTRSIITTTFAVAVVVLCTSGAAVAQFWDVSADFDIVNNPGTINGGVWSYGQTEYGPNGLSLDTASFLLYDEAGQVISGGGHPFAWQDGVDPGTVDTRCAVSYNESAEFKSFFGIDWEPMEVNFVPDQSGAVASTVRFTAPADNLYFIQGEFADNQDCCAGRESDFWVTTDSEVLFNMPQVPASDGLTHLTGTVREWVPFDGFALLAAGESIYFASGKPSTGGDHVVLRAQVFAEPPTFDIGHTWDVSDDYSFEANPNPNNGGVWEYGQIDYGEDMDPGTSIGTYQIYEENGQMIDFVQAWQNSGPGSIDEFGGIASNPFDTQMAKFGITIDPMEIDFAPDSFGNPAVVASVKFTAPVDGVYLVHSEFQDNMGDCVSTAPGVGCRFADAWVLSDADGSLFHTIVDQITMADQEARLGVHNFDAILSLSAGESIYFSSGRVDQGSADHTSLEAQITLIPEPSSGLLFTLAMIPLVGRLRKKTSEIKHRRGN